MLVELFRYDEAEYLEAEANPDPASALDYSGENLPNKAYFGQDHILALAEGVVVVRLMRRGGRDLLLRWISLAST